MDRWKSRGGKNQRGEEKEREDQRGERLRRKKMQVGKKVGKSRFTMFFQWFVAPEDRKVGSLKRRVRSQLARWEMKNCTPLWREAHFQVKMYKARHSQTTFGSWDVEKVHADVARAHLQVKVHKTHHSRPLLEVKMSKKCTPLWKHIFNSKCTKHTILGPLLEVKMSKKCTPLWKHISKSNPTNSRTAFGSSDVEKVHAVVEAHFQFKMCKKHISRTTFGR